MTLPITVINNICEYVAHLGDSEWITVFDEKTHKMKKVVNKYNSQFIHIRNRLSDNIQLGPRKIRLELESNFYDGMQMYEDAEIYTIMTYPSIRYYVRYNGKNVAGEGDDVVIFFEDDINMESVKGSILITSRYGKEYIQYEYTISRAEFSPTDDVDLKIVFIIKYM